VAAASWLSVCWRGGERETFINGAVDLLKRHSGIVWDPGNLRYFSAGKTQGGRESFFPTISEGVSRLASLSITPYCKAWGYPTNIPISRTKPQELPVRGAARRRDTSVRPHLRKLAYGNVTMLSKSLYDEK